MPIEHLDWLWARQQAALQSWQQGDGQFVLDVLLNDYSEVLRGVEKLTQAYKEALAAGATVERATILQELDWSSWAKMHRIIEARPPTGIDESKTV